MVKIRLRRTGAKKKPSYRVVVADSRASRDGRFIEIIGHYNPRTDPVTVNIHEDRALYWLSVGAQPTESVQKLLKGLGTLDRFARLKQGADSEELLAEAEATRERRAEDVKARAKKASQEEKAQKQIEVKEEETEAPEAEAEVSTEESDTGLVPAAIADPEETPSEDA